MLFLAMKSVLILLSGEEYISNREEYFFIYTVLPSPFFKIIRSTFFHFLTAIPSLFLLVL